jgi:hypothetical protein
MRKGVVSHEGSVNCMEQAHEAVSWRCMCGERGETFPLVLCLLIPVLVAVGSQGDWRRVAYPHSGHTAAGFGYQQSEYVAF